MRRLSAHVIILVVLIGAIALAHPQPPLQQTLPVAQQPTFGASTSAVMVDATVRDRSRRAVTDLKAGDFAILDNGVAQTVADVSFGTVPIDVTVGLDISSSISAQALDQLRRSVVTLMGDLRGGDRLRLMLFSLRVNRTVDFTADVRQIDAAMRAVSVGGGTSLMDGISVALVSASQPDRRQLVVFFTDGRDSSSTTSPAMLELVAERTRATVAFVVPTRNPQMYSALSAKVTPDTITAPPPTAGTPAINPIFTRLAADTGGSVIPIGAGVDPDAAFRNALETFRSTYVLYFSPKGVERSGFHTLSVSVNRPGVVVTARRGYFGG